MKTKPRIRGKIVAITKQGAKVRLDDGREGFVSTTDYFWNEWVGKRDLAAGESLEFDELGGTPDGGVSLGFEPIGEKWGRLVGIDVHYVTSLEEIREECPDEVSNIERHPLFQEEDDEGCAGWMRVARLLEECPDDSSDEVDKEPEDEDNDELEDEDVDEPEDDGTGNSHGESRQLEDELLTLAKTLLKGFENKTELGLMLTILGWHLCDRIHTLPLAGTEGRIDQEGRCCVFTVYGMEEVTSVGQRFYERSECRAWAQYG